MTLPQIVSPSEWLEARKALLVKEKELTRARDALNAERRRLPMVEVTDDYVFEGPDGKIRLPDLFDGRRQLFVYHAMFAPEWERACASCSAWLDELSKGQLRHLGERETTFAAVSRAPFAKIDPFRTEMGWEFPWYSSHGSGFNHDFGVTLDESVRPIVYNYRTKAEHESAGSGYYVEGEQPIELPGVSCFLRDGDAVFHTYSSYGRGGESVGGSSYFLDLTALGRQEDWEEPKGRASGGIPAGDARVRYPDQYDD
ncbi:DUF899 domain-containing protein [Spirillospora sp. CA-294931]|uniref:DUF899 domain-containing protein n=1 Tax=Spirillospora sp. CA-294931 TaxID=3240042 RepID=UPI003D925DEE